MTDHPPEVLFVCVHNAGRPQMGGPLLAHYARGTLTRPSPRTAPADDSGSGFARAVAATPTAAEEAEDSKGGHAE